ncbi:MAG TPA: hypothetical protein VFW04_06595 [Gemmatimonadaceae bacterium]|nr:hypothetical protein [Gemmatimonadaceae bacterium]
MPQVEPEPACVHHCREVLVRRADKAKITGAISRGANWSKSITIERTEQLWLSFQRECANFVKEHRAAVRLDQVSAGSMNSSRKCATDVAEDDALEKRRAERADIARLEGAGSPACEMEAVRNQLFARTRRSKYQDGEASRSNARDGLTQAAHDG